MIFGWPTFKIMWNTPISGNWQLKKFLFLVTAAILNGGQGYRTKYWKGTTQRSSQPNFLNYVKHPHFLSSLDVKLKTRWAITGSWEPLVSNFLFTNLFSIKFLYFFIISSLFPYFKLAEKISQKNPEYMLNY
jgi:hypothetical protein